jgi:hypothetical protein
VPLFSPWSRINCREQEIDALSGLGQDTRYLYWIPVSRRVSGTAVSKALSVDESSTREHRCHQVNAFGPYTGHSPHYRHHSALHQVRQLELIWDFHDAGPAERAAHARDLLREWQEAGTDETADAYLQELMKGAEDAASGHD